MSATENNQCELEKTIRIKAEIVLHALAEKKERLSLAESCTGGLISKIITDIPGSSDVFEESVVTYSNESKEHRLRVSSYTLNKFGAVSSQCVEEMATGLLVGSNSDLAFSVSGIAGPTGGSLEKPVGTVHFGIANKNVTKTFKYNFDGERDEIRLKAALQAFEIMKEFIEKGDL